MKAKVYIAAFCVSLMLLIPGMEVQAMEESQVAELTEEIGAEYNICPELLQAVAWHESHYDETAEASGCIGLMQVSEKWHKERMGRLQVNDLSDPEENIRVAADYLAELFRQYEDTGMVLMVYSGDSGAKEYAASGEGLSEYAEKIMEHAYSLERQHGK